MARRRCFRDGSRGQDENASCCVGNEQLKKRQTDGSSRRLPLNRKSIRRMPQSAAAPYFFTRYVKQAGTLLPPSAVP